MSEKREIKSFRDLDIYKLALSLDHEVYRDSLKFPKFELYELGSQIRRSAHSIPANIAEGWGRRSVGEMKHFFIYASASIDETTVHLDSAKNRGYLDDRKYRYYCDRYETLGKMLNSFIRKLESKAVTSY